MSVVSSDVNKYIWTPKMRDFPGRLAAITSKAKSSEYSDLNSYGNHNKTTLGVSTVCNISDFTYILNILRRTHGQHRETSQ